MASASTSGAAAYISEADSLFKTDPRKAESLYRKVLQVPKGVCPHAVLAHPHTSVNVPRLFSVPNMLLGSEDALRDPEYALVKLGQLYRDEKWIPLELLFETVALLTTVYRNATALAELLKTSRSFMSAGAKAKTAKLSGYR